MNRHKRLSNNAKGATDTSTCDTSTDTADSSSVSRKKPVQTRIQALSDVSHVHVAIACKSFGFRPWRSVAPLVRFLRRKGFNVNAVLNQALLFYLDARAGDDRLRDDARLALLRKEERELVQLNKMMLRSGAYLDLYADKVLRGGKARLDARLGRQPLAVLAPNEEPVFKRMVARREAIVKEVLEILDRRLPDGEYVLKEDRPAKRGSSKSRSRRRDKSKPLRQRGGA